MKTAHWPLLAIASTTSVLLVASGGGIGVIAGAAFILLLITMLEWPLVTFCIVLCAQLVVPVYVVIPPIAFLPTIPAALVGVMLLLPIFVLEAMYGGHKLLQDGYGRKLIIIVGLFALMTFLSLFDENSGRDSVLSWIRVVAVPLTISWMTLHKLRTVQDVQKLFFVFMFAGVAAAFYAFYEFYIGKNLLIENVIMTTEDSMKETMSNFYLSSSQLSNFGTILYRCFSFFISPIELGTFMTMIFPFPMVMSVNSHGIKRWFYGFVTVICLLGLLSSFSRGPILTCMIQVSVISIMLPKLRKLFIGTALMAMLALMLAWPIIGDYVNDRVKNQDNVTLRFKLWQIGLNIVADNPLLGVGIGNFPKVLDQAERESRVMIYEPGADNQATVDNTYIQMATETGLLGVGAFLAAAIMFFIMVIRLYRRIDRSNVLSLALVMGVGFSVFGYLFSALTFTAYNFLVITPMLFLLYSAGIILERQLDFKSAKPVTENVDGLNVARGMGSVNLEML